MLLSCPLQHKRKVIVSYCLVSISGFNCYYNSQHFDAGAFEGFDIKRPTSLLLARRVKVMTRYPHQLREIRRHFPLLHFLIQLWFFAIEQCGTEMFIYFDRLSILNESLVDGILCLFVLPLYLSPCWRFGHPIFLNKTKRRAGRAQKLAMMRKYAN